MTTQRAEPLKLDLGIGTQPDIAKAAVTAERHGIDRVLVPETAQDPFPPLAVAASHTASVEVGTGVRSRSPARR